MTVSFKKRVHHGSNREYINKNYAGIFIIWDRMFGTFEKEQSKVIYGVKPSLNSINPWTDFTHGMVENIVFELVLKQYNWHCK